MNPITRLTTVSIVCATLGLLLTTSTARAAPLYVWLGSPNPTPPYTGWATAATNIQDAVDAAVTDDEIVVTNGVYATGGRAVYGMNNRVAVTKPVTIRSVNGPEVTQIVGYQVPGTTNGPAAVRCVYLTNGAVLAGFTLTRGATQTSGDSYTNLSGGGVWCDGLSAEVSNCVLTGNSAHHSGGGAYYGTLNHCTLTGNSADWIGGGAYNGTLNCCTLMGNSAFAGGGAWQGMLNHCTLTRNSAGEGGGAYYSTLYNCIVYYNSARLSGGNYEGGRLNYCCTTPLPASDTGNTSAEPQLAGNWHLSATSPCRGTGRAAYGSGVDLDGEPWANPPSIGCDEYWSGSVTGALSVAIVPAHTDVAAGFAVDFQAVIGGRVNASRWDFGDGVVVSNRPYASHAWAAPGDYVVELRAYNETYSVGVAASMTVRVVARPVHYVSVGSTNPVPPYTNWVTAATNIQDAVDATVPGAQVLVNDGVYETGASAVYGMSNRVAVTRPVTVQSVNGPVVTQIVGYQVPATTNGPAAVRCVYLTNGAVLAGFTLTNGATQIYPADYERNQSGGGIWCEGLSAVVSNCTLKGNSACVGGGASGGTLYNCTLAGNSAEEGGGAYFGTLNYCTLSGNRAIYGGGGAYSSTLNHCTLSGNSVHYGAGGGAAGGTLYNCTLAGNSASSYGGGASYGTLNHCTLTGNSADNSGGAYGGTLNNCIVFYNSARYGSNYHLSSRFAYSCTTPLPMGPGNLTDVPSFVDTNGWSDLRLQSNSPCINAGNNAYTTSTNDLDGNPRIVGGAVDMGAYEFQSPSSQISYAWLQQYGLPIDGSADTADSDGDAHYNWQEWRCGTDPTNAASVLRLLAPVSQGNQVSVSWPSVPGLTYFLERSMDLSASPVFHPLATNLPGQAGVTTYLDTNAPGLPPRFYRVGVSY